MAPALEEKQLDSREESTGAQCRFVETTGSAEFNARHPLEMGCQSQWERRK